MPGWTLWRLKIRISAGSTFELIQKLACTTNYWFYMVLQCSPKICTGLFAIGVQRHLSKFIQFLNVLPYAWSMATSTYPTLQFPAAVHPSQPCYIGGPCGATALCTCRTRAGGSREGRAAEGAGVGVDSGCIFRWELLRRTLEVIHQRFFETEAYDIFENPCNGMLGARPKLQLLIKHTSEG